MGDMLFIDPVNLYRYNCINTIYSTSTTSHIINHQLVICDVKGIKTR
jgi:hypothetical protein